MRHSMPDKLGQELSPAQTPALCLANRVASPWLPHIHVLAAPAWLAVSDPGALLGEWHPCELCTCSRCLCGWLAVPRWASWA